MNVGKKKKSINNDFSKVALSRSNNIFEKSQIHRELSVVVVRMVTSTIHKFKKSLAKFSKISTKIPLICRLLSKHTPTSAVEDYRH